jgi:thiol-disulfide isomerase/thioredoxin
MQAKTAWFFLTALIIASSGTASDAVKGDVARVLPTGISAPVLHANALDGRAIPTWKALKGKVVVVDFWATWCPPCIASFPKFNALVDRYASQGVEFFSITYEPASAVTAFVAKHPLRTTIAVDDDFSDFRAYNAWGIPVAYVFDRSGKLAAVTHPDNLSADVINAVLAGHKPKAKPATPWSDPAGAEKYFKSLQDDLKSGKSSPG